MNSQPPGHAAILDAARAEFAERGYAAATIRNIAQRAGLSLSALYYYYRSKQEVLVALLEDGLTSYTEACDRALGQAGPGAADRLDALVEATVRFRATHPAKSTIGRTERRSLQPEHQQAYRDHEVRGTERFRTIIEQGISDGEFRTLFPDEARRTIIATCNAIAEWFDPDGDVSLDELVERYVAIALTVVEYRPRRAPRRQPRVEGTG